MIKGTLHQEDLILLNIYAPNHGVLKYVKQLLTEVKGETKKSYLGIFILN